MPLTEAFVPLAFQINTTAGVLEPEVFRFHTNAGNLLDQGIRTPVKSSR